MAISQAQKVDYLWKKIGFGKAKTDVNSAKNATNESIASPLLLRGDNVWAQAGSIPTVMPASSEGVVEVYPTTAPDETTADNTAASNRTWKTGEIDWIPPEIGSTYNVKVYLHTAGDAANAASSGTQVFGAGSGNDDEWYFDYQSGTLNFIGTNLPSGISGKVAYVSGARYTGAKGVTQATGGQGNNANLVVTGISTLNQTTTTDIVVSAGATVTGALDVDGGADIAGGLAVTGGLTANSAQISDLTAGRVLIAGTSGEIEDDAGLTFEAGADALTVAGGISVGGVSTAVRFSTGASGSAINVTTDSITGPSSITIDPAGVGDNTGDVYILGNLQVQGTQTVIESNTVNVTDLNIQVATGAANDAAADGAGFTVNSGDGNKTFQFEATGDNFGSTENINLATGKVLKVNNTEILSATALSSNVVVDVASVNIDGATAIGEDIADADLFLVDNGADGTNRKTTASDIKDYVLGGGQGANFSAINVSGISTVAFVDATTLKVSGVSTFTGDVTVSDQLTATNGVVANINSTGVSTVTFAETTTLTVGAGATVTGELDVDGGAVLNSAKVSDLTAGRVVLAGTDGEIEDSANLTFDGSTLAVTGAATVSTNLTVTQDASVRQFTASGVVTATDLRDSAGGLLSIVGVQTASGNAGLVTAFKFRGTGLENFIVSNGVADVVLTGVAASTYTTRETVTLTDGQTSIPVAAGYSEGYLDVYLNGIRLISGTDYTATDEANAVLSVAASAGDEVELVSWKQLGDIIEVESLKTTGNLNVTGIATVTGSVNGALNFTGVSTAGQLQTTDVNASGIVTASSFSGSGSGLSAGTVPLSALDIDGGTDIGADIVDTDLFIVDDGAGGTNRKTDASRIKNYVLGGGEGATFTAINVSGISTVAFVDATTLKVAGVSTFTGTVDIDGAIDADGGANIAGGLTADSAQISDLTATRLVIAGTSGELEDDANVTFANDRLVLGGSGLSATEVTASGIVTATTFHGTTRVQDIDIDGATDIGADLADADLLIVDDGAGGTNRKTAMSRVKSYVLGGGSGATFGAINVTGISTVAFVDSTTLKVSAGATVTGALDVDGGADISGNAVIDSLQVSDLTDGRVVLAGASGELEDSANLTFGDNGLTIASRGALVAAASTFSDDLDVSGDVTITGNLTVNGTTTEVNTTNMTIEDTLLELQRVDGAALSGDTNKDVGLVMNYYDGSAKKAAVYWDDSAGRFVFGAEVSESSGVLTASTYGGLEVGSLYVNDCAGASQVISCSGTTRSLENITIDGGSF